MLKEYFALDYSDLNRQLKPMLSVFNDLIFLLFPIGVTIELFKSFLGNIASESRIMYLLLAVISVSILNQYNQKVLDVSFATADSIFSYGGIRSLDGLTVMKSKNIQDEGIVNKTKNILIKAKDLTNPMGVITGTSNIITKSVGLSIGWLVAAISLIFNREIYTALYFIFLLLAPLIAYLSIIPGFENSLKALWQTFMFFAVAPIVYAITFIAVNYVARRVTNNALYDAEALIHTIILGIMLLGSFYTTYKIVNTQPITAFAEKASLMGAMVMATPFTGISSLAGGMITNPIQTSAKIGNSFRNAGGVLGKLGSSMGASIQDISKQKSPNLKSFSNHKNPTALKLANAHKDSVKGSERTSGTSAPSTNFLNSPNSGSQNTNLGLNSTNQMAGNSVNSNFKNDSPTSHTNQMYQSLSSKQPAHFSGNINPNEKYGKTKNANNLVDDSYSNKRPAHTMNSPKKISLPSRNNPGLINKQKFINHRELR